MSTAKIELDNVMLTCNDEIDNAVFDCIRTLAQEPNMEWDMQIIADVTDSIKEALSKHNIQVYHPTHCVSGDYEWLEGYEGEPLPGGSAPIYPVHNIIKLSPVNKDNNAVDELGGFEVQATLLKSRPIKDDQFFIKINL